MTSKEALEQIATIYGETNSLEGTYDLFLKIKQALERLEEWQQEYSNLQRDYDSKDLECIDLYQQNEKLKKAIEILKDYTFIEFDDVDIYLKSSNCPLSYQEYELLKEVMNNENHSE